MKRTIFALALAAMPATVAYAVDYKPAMEGYLASAIMPWASDATLVDAIAAQNAANAGLDAAAIEAMDQKWRAEVGTGNSPTIDAVLGNAAAQFLRDRVAESGGLITEVFVMDMHGLNVAASGVTSDMWQGDEAKFQETYPKGAGAVHYGDVEFDESSQSYQAQVSIPIVDPASGDVIGAMTVGIVADALL